MSHPRVELVVVDAMVTMTDEQLQSFWEIMRARAGQVGDAPEVSQVPPELDG